MISLATQQVIEEVIDEKVGDSEMFTAFNVSVEAKRRGVHERHRNLKNFIHQHVDVLINNGDADYRQELVDIPNRPQAFLYFPASADPEEFEAFETDKTTTAAPATPAPTTPSTPLTSQTRTPATSSGGVISPDGRGRVCLPVGTLRQVGVDSGDIVVVVFDNSEQELVITRTGNSLSAIGVSNTADQKRYLIDRSGNLRISQKMLAKAGITAQSVDVNVDGSKIVVSG
jgi:bifunctional DNA-binding transcriptional regulator/antitoxin component of YhaV-PrlF toxin-antitoxin module